MNKKPGKPSDAQSCCWVMPSLSLPSDSQLLAKSPQFLCWARSLVLWNGQFRSSCPGSSPTQLLVQLLPGTACETLNSLLRASSTQQQLSQQWVNNIIPILNPEHSTVTAVKKKINSIPAKPGTFVACFPHLLTCCASTAGVFAVLGSPSTRSFGWWMDFFNFVFKLVDACVYFRW